MEKAASGGSSPGRDLPTNPAANRSKPDLRMTNMLHADGLISGNVGTYQFGGPTKTPGWLEAASDRASNSPSCRYAIMPV
jgi:hypothetical protein